MGAFLRHGVGCRYAPPTVNGTYMNHAYRLALTCGAVPLLLGVSIFFLWVITRWDWLMMAGVATLYAGVAAFFIGAFALACFCWLASRSADLPRRRNSNRVLACGLLLVSNFPVAVGIVAAAIAIETCYVVIVQNNSQQVLSGIRLSGGGCEAEIGTIPPGGAARRSFWIQDDGSLEFRALQGNSALTHTIDPYVCGGMGGHTTVIISPDESISVHN